MWVYYGLIITVMLLYQSIRHLKLKNKKKAFVVCSFLLTVLLQGMRSSMVGIDIKQYLIGYEASKHTSLFAPIFNFEIGFRLLLHLMAYFHVSEQLFLVITAILCQAPIFYFIYRKANHPLESLLIYYTFGLFTFSFSGIRQMMSIGIFLLAVVALEAENLKGFVLLVLLAASVHTSAALGFLAYFLSKIVIKKRGKIFLSAIFAAELFFGKQLVLMAESLYGKKSYLSSTGSYGLFLLYILIWMLGVLILDNKAPWNSYCNYMMLAAFIQGLGAYHETIGRAGYGFSFFACILIPEIIERITVNHRLKNILYIGMVIFCFYFFTRNTASGYLDVCPYIPFWEQ